MASVLQGFAVSAREEHRRGLSKDRQAGESAQRPFRSRNGRCAGSPLPLQAAFLMVSVFGKKGPGDLFHAETAKHLGAPGRSALRWNWQGCKRQRSSPARCPVICLWRKVHFPGAVCGSSPLSAGFICVLLRECCFEVILRMILRDGIKPGGGIGRHANRLQCSAAFRKVIAHHVFRGLHMLQPARWHNTWPSHFDVLQPEQVRAAIRGRGEAFSFMASAFFFRR